MTDQTINTPSDHSAGDLCFRAERPDDIATIYRLTQTAFAPMGFSDGTEADCLNKLRDDGDLTVSYVALRGDEIIGHVALSPVRLDGTAGSWLGLGPVAVAPEMQRQGIGSQLIAKACEIARDQGALGIVLIGNPKVYGSMGFISDGGMRYRDVPPEIVQFQAFTDKRPRGALTFSKGLED